MFTWLFWCMIGFAIVDWVASWKRWRRVRWVSKPAALILLIAWFSQMGGWHGSLVWFGIGLVFSLAGDVLLALPPRFFMPGVGAFFLTHVFYIIGFWQYPLAVRWEIILPVLLIGAAFWLLSSRIRAGLRINRQTAMLIPVMAYATILSLMWLSALTTLFRPGWSLPIAGLVSLGAGLFFISDSILAYNRFVRCLPSADLLVMLTYHIGQVLIAGGVLSQFAV